MIFRNKKGQFVGRGYTGIAYYINVQGKQRSVRGLSEKKYIGIKLLSSEEFVKPTLETELETGLDYWDLQLAAIHELSERATSISFEKVDGSSVHIGYSGIVRVRFHTGKQYIGDAEIRGLSQKKYDSIEPKQVTPTAVDEYIITPRDGKRMIAALKNKHINFRGMKRAIVTVHIRGKRPIYLRLVDFDKGRKSHWSREYYLSWLIKNELFSRSLRFSARNQLKGKETRQFERTTYMRLVIQKI